MYVKVSPSRSLPASVMAFVVSSSIVIVCAVAVGASFTAFTVIVTVAGAELNEPSFAVNLKLSLPL